MRKIKINKLPKGFKLVDGNIVEDKLMRDGGDLKTGDQADYGLVTTPQNYYGETTFNNSGDESVRYSLSSVPRDNANIEAEGGETVLTDLNDNGDFGLYNITGPRHSQGGVPMFLPEQSFIYSDTPRLKFTKDEMSEFSMGGDKKTPAKISSKFGLNEYYAELDSDYADNISSRSAELMLKKNMEDLSKLAFMQESKKDFEDGVPLASHPYLMSIGVDPLEFTAKMEEISVEQARQKAIAALSPAEQEQLQYLQMMIQQSQQAEPQQGAPQQAGNPQGNIGPQEEMAMQGNPGQGSIDQMDLSVANNDMMQTARFGSELGDFLKKAQDGEETNTDTYFILGQTVDRATWLDYTIRNNMHRGTLESPMGGDVREDFIADLSAEERAMYAKALKPIEDWDIMNKESYKWEGDLSEAITVETEPAVEVTDEMISEATVTGVQDDGTKVTTGKDPFINPYDNIPGQEDNAAKLQKYHEDGYTITEKDGKINIFKAGTSKWEQNTNTRGSGKGTPTDGKGVPIYSEDIEGQGNVVNQSGIGRYRYGSLSEGSRDKRQKVSGESSYGSGDIELEENQLDFEDRWGDVTATIDNFDYKAKRGTPQYKKQWTEFQTKAEAKRKEEAEAMDIPYVPYFKKRGSKGYVPGESFDGAFGLHTFNTPRLDVDYTQAENYEMDLPDKPKVPTETPPLETPEGIPKRWWAQDENNLTTLASLDDTLRTPFGVPIERQKIDYVLDDWAGQVGANNANLAEMASALTAAGGPQALLRSNVFGQTMDANAKVQMGVNQKNVQTMNRVATLQPQLDMKVDMFNNKMNQGVYDNTNLALENLEQNNNARKIKANELFNQGATNAANTYNLNQLYDNYNINPSVYGDAEFTQDGRKLVKNTQKDELNAYYDKVADYQIKTGKPMPDKLMEQLYPGAVTDDPNLTAAQVEYRKNRDAGNTGAYNSNVNVQGQKGKETKSIPRWAVPFYTGKAGI